MRVNWSEDLSGTFFGTGIAAATLATLPYVRLRPDDLWKTTPWLVEHSDGATPHCCAAAPMSMARADAPALRNGIQKSRMAVLSPVSISPNPGTSYAWSGCATSVRTRLIEASNSSTRMVGRPLITPWPISDLLRITVMVSSGAIRTQIFGLNSVAAAGTVCAHEGNVSARPSPAPSRPVRRKNSD